MIPNDSYRSSKSKTTGIISEWLGIKTTVTKDIMK